MRRSAFPRPWQSSLSWRCSAWPMQMDPACFRRDIHLVKVRDLELMKMLQNTPCMESLHTLTEDQPLYVLCVLSCQCYGVSQIHFLLATAGAWEIPTAGCPSHAPNFARKRIIESIPCPPEKPRVFELIRSLHWWFETRRSVFETARLVTQKGGLSFVAGGKLFL